MIDCKSNDFCFQFMYSYTIESTLETCKDKKSQDLKKDCNLVQWSCSYGPPSDRLPMRFVKRVLELRNQTRGHTALPIAAPWSVASQCECNRGTYTSKQPTLQEDGPCQAKDAYRKRAVRIAGDQMTKLSTLRVAMLSRVSVS